MFGDHGYSYLYIFPQASEFFNPAEVGLGEVEHLVNKFHITIKNFLSHFLLNSRCPRFCDNFERFPFQSYSLFRSYGVILPSSFNTILSSFFIY